MFTGRLRSEIPTALVRISDTALCSSLSSVAVYLLPASHVLFLCIHQRSLGSALMSAGARLTELDLSDNAFGPDCVKGIEQLLKSPSCHTLRELKLNNCGMGIGGGKVSSKTAMRSRFTINDCKNVAHRTGLNTFASQCRP